MTLVKICGIRRSADIEILNELMPDYAGFIFCNSKRKVTVSEAEELIKKLDISVGKVGVFKNNDVDEVIDAARYLKLDVIQLHGDENEKYLNCLKAFNIWKAVHIDVNQGQKRRYRNEFQLECIEEYSYRQKIGSGRRA